jgi:hypothetical protein
MNEKIVKVILGVIVVVLLGVVFYRFEINKSSLSLPPSSEKTYENEYMKVAIPDGWEAKEATKTVYVSNCINKQNCSTIPKTEPNPAAVNITKGNFILYINTQAQQASGVNGGRFAEIAMGAPSADAVVKVQPSSECGVSEKTSFQNYVRVDWYVDSQNKQEWCNVPSTSTVWYFSYVTTSKGGYFNYYNEGSPTSLVITMAYNSKNVNDLPIKGSAELNSALEEMTRIVNSLEIKRK